MQRFGSFLWSGDVSSTWETLQTHLPVALNTGLTGIPYWGTDMGGFVPTKELTAELYVRWFQFGAFCPLFRSHGRAWRLRLPWGWNTGEIGPEEMSNPAAVLPDASQLHNPDVERICRKYLELRYRLLPYLYSAIRECTQTGMPVMRALWLHYPEDPLAIARSDEYLWGPNMLVAPVVEKRATERKIYLPRGDWHDFWTGERLTGGREVARAVDLETIPLYVRAGSILPLGPVRQYVDENIDEPIALTVYPGADGSFRLYEDDGRTFDYRRGAWMGVDIKWQDSSRTLSLDLVNGSRMLPPTPRKFRIVSSQTERTIEFAGPHIEMRS
jgi:alpha-glucosidase/alpha-D-xyloside xylohydrolase